MPTIGLFSGVPPIDPSKVADPKSKMPPSEATSRYPSPAGMPLIPTIGLFRGVPPIEPWNVASPKLKTPPSEATSQ